MAKLGETGRGILMSIAMAFTLQLPLFFVLQHVFQSVSRPLGLNRGLNPPNFGNIHSAIPQHFTPTGPISSLQNVSEAKILKPHGMAHYTFVEMSAYRASLRTFFVIGITSVILRRAGAPVQRCEWHPNNATNDLLEPLTDESLFQTTDANILYINYDENGELYATAIINCTFGQEVGNDGYGGLLTISVFIGGRYVKATNVVALREGRKEVDRVQADRPKLEYSFCGPPIHNCVRPYWFLHWLTYHHYIFEGKGHFFFYNVGGVTEEARHVLDPFLKAGLLTIIDVPEQKDYISWYYNQVLFINDCLHRSRHLATWVLFHDLDEFLYVAPPNTLRGLLEEHKEKPWITYGSVPASTGHCRLARDAGEWPLERFLCKGVQPECRDETQDPWMCIAQHGRRKYIAQARMVVATGVHKVAIPATQGVNLNSSIARVYHYRSALSSSVSPCSIPVNLSLPEDQLRRTVPGYSRCYRDDSFPLLVHEAKAFAANLLNS